MCRNSHQSIVWWRVVQVISCVLLVCGATSGAALSPQAGCACVLQSHITEHFTGSCLDPLHTGATFTADVWAGKCFVVDVCSPQIPCQYSVTLNASSTGACSWQFKKNSVGMGTGSSGSGGGSGFVNDSASLLCGSDNNYQIVSNGQVVVDATIRCCNCVANGGDSICAGW